MPVEIRLKQIREDKGFSQFELAQKVKMSPQNIQKLEQGRAKGIQLDTLDILCEILCCSVSDLLVRVIAAPETKQKSSEINTEKLGVSNDKP